ncbi:uncharacterized protein LOC117653568 [Thrips palmi]|uniref:Uncharacterized protein LOC117653568 n=1 Tax=Thrips palmi TaxID=161013 RepID=A0A6P9AAV7_THRPL|nr:uncharacterized protein LOC117653568 [Thrips palmi]XP_034255238.1 uncharacterized protein LOC117653568 [Thrips palmi]XP_034255240.1 uncharacterized protein LOC117653568 [Thrips palmi]XP_034255241.1 uncharacterized protein LOC117653568 [Thrips palmi]XP_034255242.1 uncharacterized protein LOC117653568 [Thrips palmi]
MNQQTTTKTPCRAVGLRRIPSASKSEPILTSACTSHDNDATPKSHCSSLKIKPMVRRSLPPLRCLSNIDMSPAEAGESKKENPDMTSKRTFSPNEISDANATKKLKICSTTTSPTLDDLQSLRRRIAAKEKRLKELRQAEIICKKHNPEKLSKEIQQWLCGCQEALQDLLDAVNAKGHDADMEKLLLELGIPCELVQFNNDTQEFENGTK